MFTFPFTIFLLFQFIFPLFFAYSFPGVGLQKFPGGKRQGGTLSLPCPHTCYATYQKSGTEALQRSFVHMPWETLPYVTPYIQRRKRNIFPSKVIFLHFFPARNVLSRYKISFWYTQKKFKWSWKVKSETKTKTKNKNENDKTKTKKSSPYFVTYPLRFSIFYFLDFQFSTIPFSSLYPVGQQKFPGEKGQGNTLSPCPPSLLLHHCIHVNNCTLFYSKVVTQLCSTFTPYWCSAVISLIWEGLIIRYISLVLPNLKMITIGRIHKNEQLLDWPFTRLLLEFLYIKTRNYLQVKDHGLRIEQLLIPS